MTTTDLTAAARTVADEAARAFQDAFADRMVATYLLGSLAYGGFAPAVSDIDLAVVLTETLAGDAETVQATSETLHSQGDLYRKLSVFWGSLPALRDGRDDGRFPALDRLELADHGLLLLGGDVAGQVARPARSTLLLESARFAVTVLATDQVVAEYQRPRRLLVDSVWFTKAVLFPVRFLYTSTVTTGRAARNDEAIAWYLAQPGAPASSLVRLAERVRAGHPLDAAEVGAELVGLVPLYQYYIGVQERLLLDVGASGDLVAAFTRWSARLATP